jgi:hypothetical protein
MGFRVPRRKAGGGIAMVAWTVDEASTTPRLTFGQRLDAWRRDGADAGAHPDRDAAQMRAAVGPTGHPEASHGIIVPPQPWVAGSSSPRKGRHDGSVAALVGGSSPAMTTGAKRPDR